MLRKAFIAAVAALVAVAAAICFSSCLNKLAEGGTTGTGQNAEQGGQQPDGNGQGQGEQPSHSHTLLYVPYKAAECVAAGNREYWVCTICGNYYADGEGTVRLSAEEVEIAAKGHKYVATVVDPSCEERGYTVYTCADCGDSYTDPLSYTQPAGHKFSEWQVTTPSTCLAEGEAARTCSACGRVESKVLPLGGHSYGEWHVTTPASCVSDGEEARSCSVCGNVQTRVISQLTHNYAQTIVAATCTAQGYTLHKCSHCGDEYKEDYTPVVPHNYISQTVTKPTCTQNGTDRYTCSACGDSYTKTTEATGHSYGEWLVATPATCTAEGEQIKVCGNCGDTVSRSIPKTAHSYKDTVILPDCESGGYTLFVCEACGDKYRADFTDPLGHDYVSTVVSPTCTQQGYTLHRCSRCDSEYKDSYTPVVPHSYNVQTVTNPTCTQSGEDKYTCTKCGYSYTKTTEATGHSYGDWQVIAPATCTADGEEIKVCGNCGDTVSQTIPKIAHSYKETVIMPDCENGGYTLHRCEVCGYEYKTDFTGSLGHEWTLTEEGTLENGVHYKKYVCSRCHDEKVEEGEPPAATEGLKLALTAQGWYAVTGLETDEEQVTLTIPSEYNGVPVCEIANGAFSNNLSIISASLPHGITYIGERAFYGCNSLATLSIPYTVETIGEQAFAYCGALESIWYDAVNVPIGAFDTFASAGVEAEGITFTIGAHAEVVPAFLFRSSVVAPKIVEVVCGQGSALREVGESAFYGCAYLRRVELPSSLLKISAEAFCGCSSLSYVCYPATASVSKSAFNGVNADCDYNIYQVSQNALPASRRREA